MTHLTRRHVLAGAAAIGGAATLAQSHLGSPAHAAAPMAGKQNPGWYRYKVGQFEITVVTDGASPTAVTERYVANAPKSEVSAALVAGHSAPDTAMHSYTPIVVNTGAKLVVMDTGVGLAAYQQSKGLLGQFHDNLAAAGIDKNAVDIVIISHLHSDHINGLLGADNKPAFANAEIMMPAVDVKFWTDDANAARLPDPIKGQFANVKRVLGALGSNITQYEGSKELVSGITSMPTPGHTPGHTSFVIASGSDRLLSQVDVTGGATALFMRQPGWHFLFDTDGPVAEQTRRKFYDMAVAEKARVQGFHFPFPAVGYVEKDGPGYRFVPAPWNPTV
jgi:glyoxylase-like metal-dependent hydrolase (beta-lactamase superfamily II)